MFNGNFLAVEFDRWCIERLRPFNSEYQPEKIGMYTTKQSSAVQMFALLAALSGDLERAVRNLGHDSSHSTGEITLINP